MYIFDVTYCNSENKMEYSSHGECMKLNYLVSKRCSIADFWYPPL